jgi:UDP-GlcNAc:undecaprenyl-phosphate GlcNAc-1-phosphate transferase
VFETRLLLGFSAAMALVFWGTPVAIRVAARLNFYDEPAGYKAHGAPTPYLGGAPVVIAFMAVLAMLTNDWERTLPLAGGVIVLWGLGTLDDRRTVSPRVRVAVESGLAALLYAAGSGWELGADPVIELAVTVVWVVAVVNALNLFDNMDGAASSIALVISAGVIAAGVLAGDAWLAISAAGLCGACFGFLPHNLARPARIFLGDGGSMPLGFAVAALVMIAARGSEPAWQALALGVLLVGVPVLDTCLVMVSRRRRGVSILTAGTDHLTHRTFRRLRTTRAVAFALGSVQALLATLGLFASRQGSGLLLLAVVVYLIGAATAIVLLDRGTEAARSAPHAGAARTVAADPRRAGPRARPELVLLAVIGLAVGVSPFFGAFYAQTLWAPIGLGVLALVTAVAIAMGAPLARAAVVAVGALAALGALALLSSSWADSATNAVVAGNRYLVYAAFLALVLMLVRDARGAMTLLGAFAVGALAVACADLARMFSGDIGRLFVGGRLNEPLGYINGQGSFFLLAAWPCIALAEQRRYRWLAGLALAAATLLLGLAFMAQSRGVVLAATVSLVAAVALAPGRRRRVAAAALIAAGLGAAAPDLIHVFNSARLLTGVPDQAALDAARTLALASAAVGLAWWGALELERNLRTRGEQVIHRLRVAATAGVAIVAVAALGVSLVNAGRIARGLQHQYSAFVHLEPTRGEKSSTGRLASGGGNRYDYWRVAANTWAGDPAAGVGAGNFAQPYYRERRTTEAIMQPHSIELQTLAELGLIGGALLGALLGALVVALRHQRDRARASDVERGLLVASGGILAAWTAHSSVDWMHLIPGVSAAALIVFAVLLRGSPGPAAAPGSGRPQRTALLVGVCAIAVALAAVSLSRQTLSDWFRSKAQTELARSPADAVKWADRSLRLDPDAPATYYVKAAAAARVGDARAAEAILRTAIAREPGNFLSYALLGDVYTRQGKIADAKRAYQAALARNPREPALIDLARDPQHAGALENR